MRLESLADVSRAEWELLASRRIFFGHQSVGRNIMDGVREILSENPQLPLRVAQADDPSVVEGPALIDGRVGANRDPASKTAAFVKAASEGLGAGDIALHKYCYVDVGPDTDPDRLFEGYAASMRQLASTRSSLTIVHVTLPLTTSPMGAREIVKTALGRPTETTLNFKRNRFNGRMRAAYGGTEPLFDLAELESTRPNGTRAFNRHGRRPAYMLAPEWTYDNGHLNEAGRRYVAEQLLVSLARISAALPRATDSAGANVAPAQFN